MLPLVAVSDDEGTYMSNGCERFFFVAEIMDLKTMENRTNLLNPISFSQIFLLTKLMQDQAAMKNIPYS